MMMDLFEMIVDEMNVECHQIMVVVVVDSLQIYFVVIVVVVVDKLLQDH
jgi:hypothetical protein